MKYHSHEMLAVTSMEWHVKYILYMACRMPALILFILPESNKNEKIVALEKINLIGMQKYEINFYVVKCK